MRRPSHCILAGLVVLLSGVLASAAPKPAVEVKSSNDVERKTFDPDNPPAEMPALEPPEAAVTVSHFTCAAQMRVLIVEQKNVNGVCHAKAKVESMQVTLGLDITIWLPNNGTRKIKVHEEGHREISEHYFAPGEEMARRLAEPYIGKTIEGSAADCTAAVDEAIKAVIQEFGGKYMAAIEAPAARAQAIFDELTDHGRNNVKEKEAIRQAIEQADAMTEKQEQENSPRRRGGRGEENEPQMDTDEHR